MTMSIRIDDEVVEVPVAWLRLQCPCPDCQVPEIGDRRYALHDEPADLSATDITERADRTEIRWSSGHRSTYPRQELSRILASSRRRVDIPRLWGPDHVITAVRYDDFWADGAARVAAIESVRDEGIVVVRGAPARDGEVERFLIRIGVAVRQTPFARVHDVKTSPEGYTIADTTDHLPPHNDLCSYSWPPSGQALHMVANVPDGGDSIVLDGWRLVERLRNDDPAAFELLATVPAAFRIWNDIGETFARQPLIRLDGRGRVAAVRWSNQTLQPLSLAEPDLVDWYDAYRRFGLAVNDPANQLRLRLNDGDMLLLHGHRVLHGRTAFALSSGHRLVQDSYFELDDLLAVRDRLTGEAR